MYVGVVFVLRRIFRHWLDHESSVIGLINSNLAILLILCLMTACIGNSDINFHHELAIENAIREKDYKAARKVGYESLDPSRTLTVLRAYALSREGTMGEHLFEYPQYYGSDGLLFSSSSQGTLRLDADSLYNYLGAKPYTAESTTDFLARICRDEVGKHTALDYYLSALLLDKKLDKFASVVEDSFFEQDTLPRYYREAIMLYKQSHPAYPRVLNDTLMIQRLQEFDKLQKEYTSPVEQKNRMRREFWRYLLVVLPLSIIFLGNHWYFPMLFYYFCRL